MLRARFTPLLVFKIRQCLEQVINNRPEDDSGGDRNREEIEEDHGKEMGQNAADATIGIIPRFLVIASTVHAD